MPVNRSAASLAFLAALVAAVGIRSAAQTPRSVAIQILAINDLHGNLDPPTGAEGRVNQIPAGGVEYLATHLRNSIRENPNSILVAAGDLMGASPLLSGLFQDSPTIESLNAMHLAVSSIGNHELDHGAAEFLRRIGGDGKTAPARYQYLAANVKTASGGTLLPATAVRSVAGVRIGFIGETLEATAANIGPEQARGLRFLEESTVANEAAAGLERAGVHTIVLLIHEGGRQHAASGGTSETANDPNACADFDGPIASIAKKLSPSIRVVLSGHSHTFYNCEIAGHLVTSAGSYGRLFTRVNLSIDPARDRIVKASARNEIVTRDVPKDPAQTAILDKYRPEVARLANRAVGSVTAQITRTANAAGETALGDVMADADLSATSLPEQGGAMVAFVNSGGLRVSVTGHPGIGVAGQQDDHVVSYGELYAARPFGNHLTVFTMTGDGIRRLLEQQFRGAGRPIILQVSDGFTYQYRLDAEAGQHIIAGSIALHGRQIAPADSVRVETLDFLVTGGDGFTVFGEGTNKVGGPVDVDAAAEYFAKHSPVAPGPQNRIVRVD